SRRRHTRWPRDWSSDVCSSDLQLAVIEKQLNLGAISRLNVLTQRNTVAQTRATIPPLEKSLAQARHQLSVYAGKLPSESGMPERSEERRVGKEGRSRWKPG